MLGRQRLGSMPRSGANIMTLVGGVLVAISVRCRILPWIVTLPSVAFFYGVVIGSGNSLQTDAAYRQVLQSGDKSDESYYANAVPYLEKPTDELVKLIPELQGLQVAPNQQALLMILENAGRTTDEFFNNTVDLVASEEIVQRRLEKDGRVKINGGVELSQVTEDNYLIHAQTNGFIMDFDEYRVDSKGNRLEPPGNAQHGIFAQNYCVSSGFASRRIYFASGFRGESTFRYLGDEIIGTEDTYVVAFAQKPGKATFLLPIGSSAGRIVKVLMQGIAWVDKKQFQIIRMRTDLLAPRPDLPETGLFRLTTDLTFSEVRLRDIPNALWVPTDVNEYWEDFGSRKYRTDYHFTKYQAYRVGVKIAPQ